MQKLSLLLIPLFALVMLAGCGDDSTIPEGADQPATDMTSEYEILSGKHTVTIKTSKGDITLKLDADAAPKTVTNFMVHANEGYYDNLIFHRVIPEFMIQGGDPEGNGTGGVSIYGDTFEDEMNAKSYKLHKKKLADEVGNQPLPDEMKEMTVQQYNEMLGYVYNEDLDSLPMERGVIAMANRGPNTNGSQFFIITREDGTPWLEGKHTVFGKVTDGMDVIDAIEVVSRDGNDKPFDDVTFSVEAK